MQQILKDLSKRQVTEKVDEMLHEIRRKNLNNKDEYEENEDLLEELFDSMQ